MTAAASAITVANIGELEDIDWVPLPDGQVAFVEDKQVYYRLTRLGEPTAVPDVLPPTRQYDPASIAAWYRMPLIAATAHLALRVQYPGGGGQIYSASLVNEVGMYQSGPIFIGLFMGGPFTYVVYRLFLRVPIAEAFRTELTSFHLDDPNNFTIGELNPLVALIPGVPDNQVDLGIPLNPAQTPPPGSPDTLVGVSYHITRVLP